jgi:hypothetical protein
MTFGVTKTCCWRFTTARSTAPFAMEHSCLMNGYSRWRTKSSPTGSVSTHAGCHCGVNFAKVSNDRLGCEHGHAAPGCARELSTSAGVG